uniref:Nose resistant-to-fluoxetine protein N-terminal domain-containing protein n=1 Tax=Lutzomyia longipalpis TaxID=7200 RepID=A0A1B0CRE8_LUTLO
MLLVGFILCSVVVVNGANVPEILRKNRTVSEEVEFRENLIHSSILYGILNATITDIRQRNESESLCDLQLNAIYEGVNSEELWALKALDASATTPEAYMWSSNFWLGSRQECNSLTEHIDLTLTDEPTTEELVYATPPFAVDYRVIYLNISTTLQIDAKFNVRPLLHLGLCLPQSCSNSQIFKAVERYTQQRPTNAFATYHIQPKVIAVKTPSLPVSLLFRPEVIALVVLCSIIMTLMIIRGLSVGASEADCSGGNEKSSALLFLECFAFRKNLSYIFEATTPKSISAIAGVRTIVCLWIVAFHILYYGLHYSESPSLFLANSQGIFYQVIWSAVIYVDVSFALSGFLLAYNFLGNVEVQNEIQGNSFMENFVLFCKHLLHRYVRLTPALFATVLQTEIVNQFMQKYSSFHISETRDFQCESFDVMFATLNIVYYKFWCRISPYIAGVFMGYIMRKILKDDLKIKTPFVVSVWTCIGILLPTSVTVTYWRNLPAWVCSIILAGGRVAVGIGTGVAIILCHLGHGGWFNAIFSHGIFQHGQKLTYTIYLLNPLVIFLLAGAKEKGIQVDFVEQLIFFLAVSVITYALAVVNSLLFERPFQKLSDSFILKRSRKATKL